MKQDFKIQLESREVRAEMDQVMSEGFVVLVYKLYV